MSKNFIKIIIFILKKENNFFSNSVCIINFIAFIFLLNKSNEFLIDNRKNIHKNILIK